MSSTHYTRYLVWSNQDLPSMCPKSTAPANSYENGRQISGKFILKQDLLKYVLMATDNEGLRGRSLSYLSLLLQAFSGPAFPFCCSIIFLGRFNSLFQVALECTHNEAAPSPLHISYIIIYDIHLYTNYILDISEQGVRTHLLSSLSLLSITSQRTHALTNSFSDSLCESLPSPVDSIGATIQ